MDFTAWQTSLRDLLNVVFRRKWSVITIISAGMIGVLVWMLCIRTESYESRARILIRIGHEQSTASTIGTSAVMITGDRTQDVNSEVNILQSTDLLEALIDRLHLDKPGPPKPPPQQLLARIRYEVKNTIHAVRDWEENTAIKLGLRQALTPREKVLDNLRQGLTVEAERNSNIVTVLLAVPDREASAPILNNLVDLYQTFRLKLYRDPGAPEFFRQESDQTAEKLNEAQSSLQNFEQQGNISSIQKQKEILLDQIATATTAMNNAEIESREASTKSDRADLEALAQDPDFASLGGFPASTFPETLMQQLADLQKEREKLRMTELDSGMKIRNNRDQFKVAMLMVAAQLRSVAKEKKAVFDKRAKVVGDLESQLRSLQEKEGKWTSLTLKARILEDEYVTYRKRLEEARATSVMEQENLGNVAVVEHAAPPAAPSGLTKSRILGLAFLLSIFAALAWLGIAEFLDHRIYTPEALQSCLGAPVIEVLPLLQERKWYRRKEVEAPDAFRRTARFLANRIGAGQSRSVLFSSAGGGEGTTGAVLAVSRHLSGTYGLKPLVIEMDHADPALLAPFQADGVKTLQAFKTGNAVGTECIRNNGSGVSLLPAERNGHDGAIDLLQVRRLLMEVAPGFDVTLMDAPPVRDPDALSAAALAKHAVLIVECGRTRYEMLERIKQDLACENVKIVGAIMNGHKRFIPGWIYRWLVE